MSTAPGVTSAPASAPRVLHHWIGGRDHESSSTRFADVTDPATGQVTARVALATAQDVAAAVAGAKAAFPGWRDASLARRTQVLFAFRELLNARADELPALITAEHGKVLSDARGEVARARRSSSSPAGSHLLQGAFTENASSRVDVTVDPPAAGPGGRHQPVQLPGDGADVVLPDRHRAGNPVVLKPSEKVPSAALWLARLWAEAGLPEGVFTVLNGDEVAVDGCSRTRHQGGVVRRLDADRPHVYETGTAHGKRVQALVARRTTWSCCPTPTSTWPPTRPSTPATDRPASAAWRSPPWSRWAVSPTSWWTGSPSAR
jgi:malonate-semialdehyde dehydrogenase (acetylating)/methylmalonate-semialdehyde dehydrogenase